MSFGVSPSDVFTLLQLTTQTYRSWKSACGDYAEITRQLFSLNQILKRVEQELHSPTSVFSSDKEDFHPLARVLSNCGNVVTQLNAIIIKFKSLGSSRRKNWDRLRLSHQNLDDLRDRLVFHLSTLSGYLDVVTLGAIGRVEQKIEDLAEMRLIMEDLAMQIRARSQAGSVMTSYDDDEKEVWRQFRRELISEGFNSYSILTYKAELKNYLKILHEEGVLDGSEYSVSTVTGPPAYTQDLDNQTESPNLTGASQSDSTLIGAEQDMTSASEDETEDSDDQFSEPRVTDRQEPSKNGKASISLDTATEMSFEERKKRYEPKRSEPVPEKKVVEEHKELLKISPPSVKVSKSSEHSEEADLIRGRQLRKALQEKLGDLSLGMNSSPDLSKTSKPLRSKDDHDKPAAPDLKNSSRNQSIDRQRRARSLSPTPVANENSGPFLLEWPGQPQTTFMPREIPNFKYPRPPPSSRRRQARPRSFQSQSGTSKSSKSENLLLTVGALLMVSGFASQRSRNRTASPAP